MSDPMHDQDEEVPRRWPKRRCEHMCAIDHQCGTWALAFVERARCFTHATDEERAENEDKRHAWLWSATSMAESEAPDDIIIHLLPDETVAVEFSYRPDAVDAFRRVAGARFMRDGEGRALWVFPLHRLAKVTSIAKAHFTEIIEEKVSTIRPATLRPGGW